jgi:hypothetical protein
MESKMTEQIANRVIKLIKIGIDREGKIGQEFFDELKILHDRSKSFFPREFNDLMRGFKYTLVGAEKVEFLLRLAKILEVIKSLPDELREPEVKIDVESSSLVPLFEIQKSDKDRIFELCNDMRKIVFASEVFDHPHRVRLLNRIAAIEAETHKPKGMFDVVRGGINDLGETLGKFGTDIKPLTDRMREVVGIARKGTKEYDQLPAPDEVKQLPPPRDDETV